MFKWLIDKSIRTQIDELHSSISQLGARLGGLETQMVSLRNLVNGAKARKGKEESEEKEDMENMSPELKHLIQNSIEFKSGRFNSLEDFKRAYANR